MGPGTSLFRFQPDADRPRAELPWDWRPGPAACLGRIGARAQQWAPAPELGVDAATAGHALEAAALSGAHWLLHPLVNAVVFDTPQNRIARDVRLLSWLAAHGALAPCPIDIPEPLFGWAPGGSFPIAAGRRDVAELGEAVLSSPAPGPIALDVWCHTVHAPIRGSWAVLGETLSDDLQQRLERDIMSFMRAWSLLSRRLPDCADWIAAAAAVVIPLPDDGSGKFRSVSDPDLPGLVQMDLAGGEVQILEGLVHESAHLHLYYAEAAAPLIDPTYERRFASPLRKELRPLRGILMA
jgi:hypothetical protein